MIRFLETLFLETLAHLPMLTACQTLLVLRIPLDLYFLKCSSFSGQSFAPLERWHILT